MLNKNSWLFSTGVGIAEDFRTCVRTWTPDRETGQLLVRANPLISLVGTAGFELATPCTPFRFKPAVRLRPMLIPDLASSLQLSHPQVECFPLLMHVFVSVIVARLNSTKAVRLDLRANVL